MKKSAAKNAATIAAKPRKPRGRPRSFDRDAALAAAIEVFWTKGFEGASISDLTEAMGVNPPSLYAAFGDKEQLFLEAMESYEKSRGNDCPYTSEPTARASIERLLTYMAQELTGSDHPRGCMMMMAASTSGNASAKLRKAVADKRASSREHLRARIKRGIEEGDVPRDADPTALADFFSTVMNGMAMMGRDGVSRKSLMATVERAMQLFPAVPASHRRREAAAA